MTRNEGGPGVAHHEPATSSTTATARPQDHGQGNRAGAVLVAPTTRYLRSGRAKFDDDLARCPLCGFGHRHRPFEGLNRYTRRPACRPTAEYLVVVVQVVPATVPVAGRRRRGAA